jgi:hypothetical protein
MCTSITATNRRNAARPVHVIPSNRALGKTNPELKCYVIKKYGGVKV